MELHYQPTVACVAVINAGVLSVVPDRYDGDDPAAPYLKMVGFGCRKNLPDALLLDDDVIDVLIEIFSSASQLVRYFD